MAIKQWIYVLLGAFSILVYSYVQPVSSSVIGIDYGTEWTKISIVKTNVPLDIVFNKESKRKTPSIVSLRQGIRSFESNAVAAATRYPQDTYLALKNLLGRSYHHPEAAEYRNQFPNRIIQDEERQSCSFKADDGQLYTTEELVAMQLLYAKQLAETFGGSENVSGAVITVPPYFNHFERQAVLDAADVAGIKVYALMNDATAIALNYAMTRSFPTPQYHIIYDMGAGSTAASLVYFQDVFVKDGLFRNKTVPQIAVQATGYDHRLGGHSIDLRLTKRFIDSFAKAKGLNAESSPRSIAKLLKEASRVKQVLSANNQVMASVENLMNDVDFRQMITRAELEEDCKDIFVRVTQPIAKVLEEAGLGLQNITSVILHGGGARIPAIQSALREYLGESMIAQNVNMDEAAALGAGLRAAALSKQFIVRDIGVKDVNEFPIDIAYDTESSKDGSKESLKMTLFHENGAMGDKKLMNFQRKSDFTFELLYSNSAETLLQASITGLTKILQSKAPLSSKVKSLIELTNSGTVHVRETTAFLELEKSETTSETTPPSGLFDKVSSFFGGKKSENDTDTGSLKDEDQPKEEVGESSSDSNATSSSKAASSNASIAPSKGATTIEKVKLDLSIKYMTFPPLSALLKSSARKRIAKMDAEDTQRLAREEAKNGLESFIYSARDFLEDAATHAISTIEQRTHLQEALHKAQVWLFDSTDEDPTHEFINRLQGLKKIHSPFIIRQTEKTKRPEAIASLNKVVDEILDYIQKDNQTHPELYVGLIDGAFKVREWANSKQIQQDKLREHEDPVFLSSEIDAKAKELQKEFLKTLTSAAKLKASAAAKRARNITSSASFDAEGDKATNGTDYSEQQTGTEGGGGKNSKVVTEEELLKDEL